MGTSLLQRSLFCFILEGKKYNTHLFRPKRKYMGPPDRLIISRPNYQSNTLFLQHFLKAVKEKRERMEERKKKWRKRPPSGCPLYTFHLPKPFRSDHKLALSHLEYKGPVIHQTDFSKKAVLVSSIVK